MWQIDVRHSRDDVGNQRSAAPLNQAAQSAGMVVKHQFELRAVMVQQ